jgi:hypothetical protein
MKMKRKLHATAATMVMLFLALFWSSTVVAEVFMSHAAVAQVKHAIAYGLLAFVPLMALTAGTGFSMGGKGKHALLVDKRKRMPFIALNGLLILVPSAIFLFLRSSSGIFDGAFYAVQVVELVAGVVNMILIGRNIRDGLQLSRRRKQGEISRRMPI